MNSNDPYWYKLISHWVKVERREGLTIPFIIGAKSWFSIDNVITSNSITDLLNEMKNSDIKDTITLFYCDTIGEYVLGINNLNHPKLGSKVENQNTGKTTLILTSSTEVLGKNLTEISNSLYEGYCAPLHDGKFSWTKFQWTKYSPAEVMMIGKVLAGCK